jgi:hypothetical protein
MENETAAKLIPVLKELNETYKGFYEIKFITVIDLDNLPDDIQTLRVICGAKDISSSVGGDVVDSDLVSKE